MRERQHVLEVVTSHVNGRIGVVAGTTAEGTRTCIGYSRNAKAAGRDGGDGQPAAHAEAQFRGGGRGTITALADAVDIEIVVQDFPPISGYAMEPWLLARIAREIPRARTIKLEDPPTPFKTSRILEQAGGLEVRIFGGLGGVFLLEELMAGATGAMTGFAYPGDPGADRPAATGPAEIDEAAAVFYRVRAADAVRVPGRHRHGHPQGSAAPPRRAERAAATRAPAAGLDATTRAALDRVWHGPRRRRPRPRRARLIGLRGRNGSRAERQGRDGRRGEQGARLRCRARRSRLKAPSSRYRRATRRRSEAAARRGWAAQTFAMAVDVKSAADITKWATATIERFGGVDLLLCNGGGPPAGPALSFDDAAWQDAANLLLFSALRMIRAVVPSMTARGGGAILVSTSSSVKEPIPNLGLSTVLRASVSALAKTLALELAPSNIRVNQIIPGRLDTDRVRELDEINGKKQGISAADAKAKSSAAIPMGRYGEADEFGRVGAFLLSNAASYMTGATVQVDGGQIRSVL